jgi:putative heme-binding domain-containing protein
MSLDAVTKKVKSTKGDAKVGKKLFTRQGCGACHTTSPDQEPKGPPLHDITTRYDTAELVESIVKPNASVAQGFATEWFKLKGGRRVQGFVTR